MPSRESRIAAVIPFSAAGISPALTMDFYPSTGRTAPPFPAVLILHGGGFVGGNSRSPSEAYCADFLAPAGYACFSVNYRLAPATDLPGMVSDVQRAIRFVRHHAAQYKVDPNRIALLGGSAGGYLSNMAGLARPSAIPSSPDPVNQASDAVQAVVTLFGLSDLAVLGADVLIRTYRLLGPQPVTPQSLAAASPVSLVRPDAPPFLLIHGDRDNLVPLDQSTRLLHALRGVGAAADLLTIPGGPHATNAWHTLPNPLDWERQTIQWLNRTLQHYGVPGEGILARSFA